MNYSDIDGAQTDTVVYERHFVHCERERRRKRSAYKTFISFALIVLIIITVFAALNINFPKKEDGAGASLLAPLGSFHADYSSALCGGASRNICAVSDGLYMLHNGYLYSMLGSAEVFTPICGKKDCAHDDIAGTNAFSCDAYVGQGYSDFLWAYNGVLYLVGFSNSSDSVFELCTFDAATGKKLDWSYTFSHDIATVNLTRDAKAADSATSAECLATIDGAPLAGTRPDNCVFLYDDLFNESRSFAVVGQSALDSFYNISCYFTGHYLIWYIDSLPSSVMIAYSCEGPYLIYDFSYERTYYWIDLDDPAPYAQRFDVSDSSDAYGLELTGAHRDNLLFAEHTSDGFRLLVYNLQTGKSECVYTGGLANIRACRIDGGYAYYIDSASRMYRVKYGDTDNGAELMHPGLEFANAVTFDELYVYCESDDALTVYDLMSGEYGQVDMLYNDNRRGVALTFSYAAGKYAYATDASGNVYRLSSVRAINGAPMWRKVTSYG